MSAAGGGSGCSCTLSRALKDRQLWQHVRMRRPQQQPIAQATIKQRTAQGQTANRGRGSLRLRSPALKAGATLSLI